VPECVWLLCSCATVVTPPCRAPPSCYQSMEAPLRVHLRRRCATLLVPSPHNVARLTPLSCNSCKHGGQSGVYKYGLTKGIAASGSPSVVVGVLSSFRSEGSALGCMQQGIYVVNICFSFELFPLLISLLCPQCFLGKVVYPRMWGQTDKH